MVIRKDLVLREVPDELPTMAAAMVQLTARVDAARFVARPTASCTFAGTRGGHAAHWRHSRPLILFGGRAALFAWTAPAWQAMQLRLATRVSLAEASGTTHHAAVSKTQAIALRQACADTVAMLDADSVASMVVLLTKLGWHISAHCEFATGVLAAKVDVRAASGPRRRQQDYRGLPQYFTASLWAFLTDRKHMSPAKLDALLCFGIKGGLRLPNEHTFKILTSTWILVSEMDCDLLSNDQKITFLRHCKSCFSSLRKRSEDPLEWVEVLPASPFDMQSKHPHAWASWFQDGGPGLMPSNFLFQLQQVDSTYGCRTSKTALPVGGSQGLDMGKMVQLMMQNQSKMFESAFNSRQNGPMMLTDDSPIGRLPACLSPAFPASGQYRRARTVTDLSCDSQPGAVEACTAAAVAESPARQLPQPAPLPSQPAPLPSQLALVQCAVPARQRSQQPPLPPPAAPLVLVAPPLAATAPKHTALQDVSDMLDKMKNRKNKASAGTAPETPAKVHRAAGEPRSTDKEPAPKAAASAKPSGASKGADAKAVATTGATPGTAKSAATPGLAKKAATPGTAKKAATLGLAKKASVTDIAKKATTPGIAKKAAKSDKPAALDDRSYGCSKCRYRKGCATCKNFRPA